MKKEVLDSFQNENSIILLLIAILLNLVPANSYCQRLSEFSNELMVSSFSENCNYYNEDYKKLYLNFEFPKLLIYNKLLVVAYIDEVSQKLLFVQIEKGRNKALFEISPFGGKHNLFTKWPTIFIEKDQIHLGVVNGRITKKTENNSLSCQIYMLNEDGLVSLKKEITLNKRDLPSALPRYPGISLSGIYGFDALQNQYLVLGRYDVCYFHPLAIFSGDFPKFAKSFSFVWEKEGIGAFETIEEKGWFGVSKIKYCIQNNRNAYSAWIRNTSYTGSSSEHNESVCFSAKRGKSNWKKPLEIYKIEKAKEFYQIENIDVCASANTELVVWNDIKQGLFICEIKDDKIVGIENIIGTNSNAIDRNIIDPLYGASAMKAAVSENGDAYIIWIKNMALDYEITLSVRKNGIWKSEMMIGSGKGVVKFPDLVIDDKGIIHVTYIKQIDNRRYGCFYRELGAF